MSEDVTERLIMTPKEGEKLPLQGKRVLVLSEEDQIRIAIVCGLKNMGGATVEEFENKKNFMDRIKVEESKEEKKSSEEAKKEKEKLKPDLIVVDAWHSEMSFEEREDFFRRMREDENLGVKDIPLIVLNHPSSSNEKEQTELWEYLNSGVNKDKTLTLGMPFEIEELPKQAAKLLEK